MSKFWKVRLATLVWGSSVTYFFTGDLGLTGMIGLVVVAGNTLIMWFFLHERSRNDHNTA